MSFFGLGGIRVLNVEETMVAEEAFCGALVGYAASRPCRRHKGDPAAALT